jgi:hypothetical protein
MVSSDVEQAALNHPNQNVRHVLEMAKQPKGQWFAEQLELAYDPENDSIRIHLFSGAIQTFLTHGREALGGFDSTNRPVAEAVLN